MTLPQPEFEEFVVYMGDLVMQGYAKRNNAKGVVRVFVEKNL